MLKHFRYIILFLLLCCLGIVSATNVYADMCGGVDTSFLECNEGGVGGVTHIIMLVVNILSIGVAIAGFVVICIFGSRILSSKGESSKTSEAKKHLYETIIGLACYAVAWALLNWLLPGGDFTLSNIGGGTVSISFTEPLEVGKTIAPNITIGGDSKTTYTLRSSDPQIANIVGSYVKCLAVGTANITAISDSGGISETTVTCIEPVKKEPEDEGGSGGSSGSNSDDDEEDESGSGGGGSSDGGGASDDSSTDKKIAIVLGASQVGRIAGSSYANVKSYTGASGYKYKTSNGTLKFIYSGGTGFSYQAGSGWSEAESVFGKYADKKDSTAFFVFFSLTGNDAKNYTCDEISTMNGEMAMQMSTYAQLISQKKAEGYNVSGFISSVQPVEPSNSNKNASVAKNNGSKKCDSSYRSNYKYKLYNDTMESLSAMHPDIFYLETFDAIVDASFNFTPDWSDYSTTDGIHFNNSTAKKYFKFWMGQSGSL